MVRIGSVNLAATALISAICAAPSVSVADIILDDFTDTVDIIESPEREDEYVETLNVGELGATREIRIGAIGARPTGTLDVNVTSTGMMTAQIGSILQTGDLIAISAVQFNYYFDPTDVTDGGRNDAIVFDFAELSGDAQPTYLGTIVRDDTHVRETYHIDVELFDFESTDDPFSLYVPFDSFTQRGGAPGLPDPTTFQELQFDFFFLGHSGLLNWTTRLERIRFGRAVVPEPSTALLICVPLVVLGCSRFARKGVRRDDSHMACRRANHGNPGSSR